MSALTIPDPLLFNVSTERLKKAHSMRNPIDSKKEFISFLGSFSEKDKKQILAAAEIIEKAEYAPGKSHYFAHPLRVGTHILRYHPSPDADLIILSLLHNILEMADTLPDSIEKQFGKWMHDSCLALRVNRLRQKACDEDYLREFYSQFKKDRKLFLVKAFDKWDNTLSLYFNPSLEIRQFYLNEIEKWLLPIIPPQDQALKGALLKIISETRKAQPISLDDYLKLHGK